MLDWFWFYVTGSLVSYDRGVSYYNPVNHHYAGLNDDSQSLESSVCWDSQSGPACLETGVCKFKECDCERWISELVNEWLMVL